MLTLLALIVLAGMQAAPEVRIAGIVRDATSLPLPGAAIEVDGYLTARTGAAGEFELVRPRSTRVTLRISLDGFDPYESIVDAVAGRRLDVVLGVAALEDHVSVAAPPHGERVEPIFARRLTDVYRTPGAQGDLFRALQALPGATAPDDGAGLFVRGGDVSEVLVTLDDAVIARPYRYETAAGGFRGAVEPMQVTGIAFATGGFSARHGNVLSAIVDLHSPDAPEGDLGDGHRRVRRSIGIDRGSRVPSRRRARSSQPDVDPPAVRRERQAAAIRPAARRVGCLHRGRRGSRRRRPRESRHARAAGRGRRPGRARCLRRMAARPAVTRSRCCGGMAPSAAG